MNPLPNADFALRVTEFWEGALVLRALLGLVAAVLLSVGVIRIVKRRVKSPLAVILLLVVALVVFAFALNPRGIITFVISSNYLARVRWIAGGVSILMLSITLEALRHTRLQERYALLWIATAMVLLLCAGFPAVVDLFRAATGMGYAAAMVAVAFLFLVLVCFDFSLSHSRTQERIKKMAQQIAILESRVAQQVQTSEPVSANPSQGETERDVSDAPQP